jgi:hypothetical protein
MPQKDAGGRKLERLSQVILQNAAVVAVAALLVVPCFVHGIPPGNDATTHVNYQRHFSEQFWHGEMYPRWLTESNKGFGSPIFFLQYPLPYWITALLRPVLSFAPDAGREAKELGISIFLILAAAGMAARFWFRRFTGPVVSTLAAIAYLALPYILEQGVYFRAAIGELCAYIWMPLLLGLCELLSRESWIVLPMGAAFGLFLVSNVLYAALFVPLFFAYAFFSGGEAKRPAATTMALISSSVLLGTGLAALYVVPFAAYRAWFDLPQLNSSLSEFAMARYFLFETGQSLRVHEIAVGLTGTLCFGLVALWGVLRARGDKFLQILMGGSLMLGALACIPSLGAMLIRKSGFVIDSFDRFDQWSPRMMVILSSTLVAGLIGYCQLSREERGWRESTLVVASCVAFVAMLPFSAPIWKFIPALEAIQFPYRIGGLLSVAVAGLLAATFESLHRHKRADNGSRRWGYLAVSGAVLWLIAGGAYTWRVDWRIRTYIIDNYEVNRDIDIMYRAYVPAGMLRAFSDRMGTKPEFPHLSTPQPGDGTFRNELISGRCTTSVWREDSRTLRVSADCDGEARLKVGQLYFSLWKVVPIVQSPITPKVCAAADGLIELALPPGKQEVRLMLARGAPERWGRWISLTVLLISAFAFLVLSPWGFWRKPAVVRP